MNNIGYYTIDSSSKTILLHPNITDAYLHAWRCLNKEGYTPISRPHEIYLNKHDMVDREYIKQLEKEAMDDEFYHKQEYNSLDNVDRFVPYGRTELLIKLQAATMRVCQLQAMLAVEAFLCAELIHDKKDDESNQLHITKAYALVIYSLKKYEAIKQHFESLPFDDVSVTL